MLLYSLTYSLVLLKFIRIHGSFCILSTLPSDETWLTVFSGYLLHRVFDPTFITLLWSVHCYAPASGPVFFYRSCFWTSDLVEPYDLFPLLLFFFFFGPIDVTWAVPSYTMVYLNVYRVVRVEIWYSRNSCPGHIMNLNVVIRGRVYTKSTNCLRPTYLVYLVEVPVYTLWPLKRA